MSVVQDCWAQRSALANWEGPQCSIGRESVLRFHEFSFPQSLNTCAWVTGTGPGVGKGLVELSGKAVVDGGTPALVPIAFLPAIFTFLVRHFPGSREIHWQKGSMKKGFRTPYIQSSQPSHWMQYWLISLFPFSSFSVRFLIPPLGRGGILILRLPLSRQRACLLYRPAHILFFLAKPHKN